jgi:hypothetical protein
VIPIAVGFYGLIGIWFIGEDSLDVEPPWIIPFAIVGICLLFFLPAAVPLTYLHLTGDRVTAVVTEQDSGVFGVPKIEKIRAVDPMTSADLGEIDYEPPGVEKPGDRFDILVDPRGWVAPDSARLDSPLPELGYGFGGTAFGVLALLTGLRIGRDLRRYRRTGSRLPPEAVADPRRKQDYGHAGMTRSRTRRTWKTRANWPTRSAARVRTAARTAARVRTAARTAAPVRTAARTAASVRTAAITAIPASPVVTTATEPPGPLGAGRRSAAVVAPRCFPQTPSKVRLRLSPTATPGRPGTPDRQAAAPGRSPPPAESLGRLAVRGDAP